VFWEEIVGIEKSKSTFRRCLVAGSRQGRGRSTLESALLMNVYIYIYIYILSFDFRLLYFVPQRAGRGLIRIRVKHGKGELELS